MASKILNVILFLLFALLMLIPQFYIHRNTENWFLSSIVDSYKSTSTTMVHWSTTSTNYQVLAIWELIFSITAIAILLSIGLNPGLALLIALILTIILIGVFSMIPTQPINIPINGSVAK
jgi:hypothetical protein